MGVLGQIPATVENLSCMVCCIPEEYLRSVCEVGPKDFPMATKAIIMAGHVRVGFEDNIYLSKGVAYKSIAQLVEKIVKISRELDREIASPDEACEVLNLPKRTLGTH